jgi:hypothetical protein
LRLYTHCYDYYCYCYYYYYYNYYYYYYSVELYIGGTDASPLRIASCTLLERHTSFRFGTYRYLSSLHIELGPLVSTGKGAIITYHPLYGFDGGGRYTRVTSPSPSVPKHYYITRSSILCLLVDCLRSFFFFF